MANPAPATILDHKLSFLSAQILALSAPLRVPSSFAQNQHQAAARRTDADTPQLRQAAIDAAMLRLNARLRQHSKQVYGHVAKRHVAEQVEGLYLRGADGEEDGDGDVEMGEGGDGEMKGLQVGMDFTTPAAIAALPPTFPTTSSSPSDEAETYTATVSSLQALDARRTALRQKLQQYRQLKDALAPLDSATENVQENLVARGGEVEKEMERMRLLVGRVVGRIGGVDLVGEKNQGEQDEDEEDEYMLEGDMMAEVEKLMSG